MGFTMDEASIDGELKTIKENKEKPFDLLAELERKMREFIPLAESQLLMERDLGSLYLVPSIPVSEIGWSTVNTTDQGEVPAEARRQLQQFLKNIQGNDLQEKVKTLSDFYANPASLMNTGGRKNQSQIIAETLAILTFFKTLTTIITHFNAASAGFSFESFLAVLLDGKQVPTNSQTIADLTTADGTPDGTPITVASIVDSDTITISAELANNSTILENTQMFFKGSSLTAKISYDLEILQVGDRDVRIQLDLDNILTITDES